jgi:hypothetical protein
MWHHISALNLRRCSNPLHKYHSEPFAPDWDVDLHYFYLTGKHLQKTFSEFDIWRGSVPGQESAFKYLCRELDKISESNDMDADP